MGAAMLLASAVVALGQQTVAPETLACGAGEGRFDVKRQPPQALVTVPEGKALVYLIEEMPKVPLISTRVSYGLDGTWVGATDAMTYMAITIDPGVHHFCAKFQGKITLGEQGPLVLKKLDVKAGETYYLLYRGLFDKTDGEIAFFDRVDEDEGLYLVGGFEHAASKPKK